jgi:hypothetical protein
MVEMQEEMYNQHNDWPKSEGRRSSGYVLHEHQYQAGQEEKLSPQKKPLVIEVRVLLGIILGIVAVITIWGAVWAMHVISIYALPESTRPPLFLILLSSVFFIVLANVLYVLYNRKP